MATPTIDHDGIIPEVSTIPSMDSLKTDALSETEWKEIAYNTQIFDSEKMQQLAQPCEPKLLRRFFSSNMGTRNLHQAAKLGKTDVMKVLLRLESIDVNMIDNVGQTALHYAAKEGHLDITRMLLAKNDINASHLDAYGNTLLHIAAKHGHVLVFEKILKDGKVDVNSTNKSGETALILAAGRGHEKIVDMLLEEPNVVVSSEDQKSTPLHAAARNGHIAIVEKLLEIMDVNLTSDVSKKSPLHLAIEGCYECVVDLLLQAPTMKPSLKDIAGNTPLHIAAEKGNEVIFEKLLRMHEVDVNAANNKKMTALHLAAENKHVNIVTQLLVDLPNDQLVDLCAKAEDDTTPLHMAAKVGSVDVVKVLLEIGKVDVNITDSNKRTAIHWATSEGRLNVVDVLLGVMNVACCLGDHNEDTPLHLAAKLGHGGIVKKLLAIPDFDVNKVNKRKETPLFVATRFGSIDVVDFLLENPEVDLSICNEHGDSPFHVAMKGGHAKIAEKLITHGSIHSIRENLTALHLCIRGGHEDFVDMLLKQLTVDANAKDAYGNFPIHYAAQNGNASIFRKILSAPRVDVNSINDHQDTALHVAVRQGHLDIVDILLQIPELNASMPDRDGNSALHVAAKYGEEEIIEKLLKVRGVDVNAKGKKGMTALVLAAEEGHAQVVDRLLAVQHVLNNWWALTTNKGQGKPPKNDSGVRSLLLAASNGHVTIIKSLLKYGVDVNGTPGFMFSTALCKAIEFGHPEVVEVLLNAPNIDANRRNWFKIHPLFIAAKTGQKEIVEKLVATRQIGVNALSSGRTALQEAAGKGNEQVVNILLNTHGIDVYVKTKNNETALFFAARADNKKILKDIYNASKVNVWRDKCMIQTQLNINETNDEGESIIHLATRKKLLNVLDFLLEVEDDDARSVDVNMKTSLLEGEELAQSALQIAIKAAMDAAKTAKEATKETTIKATIKVEHYKVVEKLTKFNSISFIQEEEGQTFLQHIFEQKEWETFSIVTTAPQVTAYIDALYKDRQASVDAANAILVGAALIASVTFASWLQPPLGYTTYYHEQFSDTLPAPPVAYPEYVAFDHHPSLQAFWVFNSLSFFSAIATVISGAQSILPTEKLFIKQEVEILRRNLLRTSILLGFSMFFVLLAFATAGVIVLPPLMKFRANIFSTIGIGGSVCFIFLFLFGRSIYKLRSHITSSQENQKGFFKRWGFKPLHKPNLFNRSQGGKD